MNEGPGAEAPGPRATGWIHHLPTRSSACRIHTSPPWLSAACGARIA